MADLRERVVEDRGLISKIQAYIPGFSGYRAKEDLRAADNMLRIQAADSLASARVDVEACRAVMARNMTLEYLESLGALIARFKTVDGEVRHAAQGYSGISSKIQVQQSELNKLYEYDLSLMNGLADIKGDAAKLRAAVDTKDGVSINANIASIDAKLASLEDLFRKRMTVITGTEA
jgi:hypothetical protein